jgi:sugar diacid utilization regulator
MLSDVDGEQMRRAPGVDSSEHDRDHPEVEQPTLTLAELVDTLGPRMLRVVSSSAAGSACLVREVTIYDPLHPPRVQPVDVVLGVGLHPSTPAFADMLEASAAARAAAVIVKPLEGTGRNIRELFTRVDVTVIAVPAGMGWEQLSLLLRYALDAAGARHEGSGDATDLFALANVIARMVGGPVTIEDAQSRVLAYSTLYSDVVDNPRKQTILGRQVPEAFLDLLQKRGVFRDLRDQKVVRMDADPSLHLRARMAIAVRAGDQILGSLWVAEGPEPLSPDAENALVEAARLAAVHLIRARSSGYEPWQRRDELLRQLLEDRADARMVAETLGFEVDRPAAVLGVELQTTDGLAADQISYDRLRNTLEAQASAFRIKIAPIVVGARLLALMPGLSDESDRVLAAIRRLGEAVAGAATKLGLPVNVAIGPVVDKLRDAPLSHAAVSEMLPALAAEPGLGPVATIDEMRAVVTIRSLVAMMAKRPDLHAGPVARLRTYDEQKGTNHVLTLRRHLEATGDMTVAARLLGIHTNTMRYRLRNISQISGIALDDQADLTMAWMHLKLIERDALA